MDIIGPKSIYNLATFRRKWRKLNPNNYTVANNIFNAENVSVGNYTYGMLTILNDRKDINITIGSFCSLSNEVTFIAGQDHITDAISTYPFKAMILSEAGDAQSKGDIVIGDDVWIGNNVTILSGVHIGQGACVAAGAVVNKDIPPYSIAGGVPNHVIKYRFGDDMIQELLKIDFSKLTKELIAAHKEDLYTELVNKNQLDWLPKK